MGHWALLLLLPLLSSCGEDPKLLERSKELDARIEAVEGEIAEIEKGLGKKPRDVSKEYELVRKQLLEAKGEALRLEAELAHLRDEKESLELRFNQYRKKHPIN